MRLFKDIHLASRRSATAPDPGQHPLVPRVLLEVDFVVPGLLLPSEPERVFGSDVVTHGGPLRT